MMKITIIGIGDPKDKTIWSGTTYNMYKALKDQNVDVDTLNAKTNNFFIKVFRRLVLYKYKYLNHNSAANFETTKIGAKYYGKKIDKLISQQKEKSDYYLTPAGAAVIAYSKIKVRYIDAPDATYSLMNSYYYSDITSDSKDDGELIDQLALNKAYRIIVPSNWCRHSVIQDYQQSSTKVKLIPFGANLPYEQVIYKNCKNKKVINLLLVGVEYKRKGIDIAINTVRQLNKLDMVRKYNLTIIGLENKYNIYDEFITFKGRLNKNDPKQLKKLQSEYKKADLFILPTKAEAAGIVFAEAAMYALPTVTYNTGGVGTYVLNDKTGYTLPTDATTKDFVYKILKLVNNDEKYIDFSKNALEYYKSTLNWKNWSKAILEILSI